MVAGERDQGPNIEEILAALRRNGLKGSEGGAPVSLPVPADNLSAAERCSQVQRDDEEFVLPQIFRSQCADEPRASSLAERLREAMGGTSLAPADAHARVINEGPVSPAPPTQEPPRVMASCKDRWVSRMGQTRSEPERSGEAFHGGTECQKPEPDLAAHVRAGARTIPKARLGANYLLGQGAMPDDSAAGEVLPGNEMGSGHWSDPASALPVLSEDQAVLLLRPLLRSWLDENMQRMFKRALHSEVAELSPRPVPAVWWSGSD